MNDTILTTRQRKIIGLFQGKMTLSRTEIGKRIQLKKLVSRITLIRELNYLMHEGYIVPVGKGRAVRYQIKEQNTLLYYIDLEEYFGQPSWKRDAHKNFNPKIFDNLSEIFDEEEKKLIESLSGGLAQKSKILNPTIYKRELERFVIEFSWKSSQIEGNTYDLLETETLIKQQIEAKGRSKEETRMILNHKDALDSILKHSVSFRTLRFSDVTQLHTTLTRKLEISTGIRVQHVGISGTEYVPMANKVDLEAALRKTINTINKTDFPPEKALIAASMIAYIQPFVDGNKRTARTLANAILIAHGYVPLSYRNVEVNEYKKATILFYEQNNLYHFKRIFIEQMKFSYDNYFR